jgi:kelch-like protein 20
MAVMKWLNHSLEARKHHLSELILHVRLPLVDTRFLVNTISTDPLVRANETCRELLDEAKDYHLLAKDAARVHDSVRVRPRKGVAAHAAACGEVLYAVGGWCSGDAISFVEMYDPQQPASEWHIVANMSKRRCGVGVGVLNNQLYAIGGHDGTAYLNTTERYDPVINQWFNDVAPTSKPNFFDFY